MRGFGRLAAMLAFCSFYSTGLVFAGQWETLPEHFTAESSDASLLGLRIEGPAEVIEEKLARYAVIATFDNGWEFDVTLDASLWLNPGNNAEIGVFGDFEAGVVAQDQMETIHAMYAFGSDVQTATLDVTILDVPLGGYALDFDGADDQVKVPRSPSLEPAEVTIELWAYLDGVQDFSTRLLRKLPSGSGVYGYILAADQTGDHRIQLRVHTPQIVVVKDSQSHDAYVGAWHHFVGVYTTTEAKLYVDGIEVNSVQHSQGAMTPDPTADLYIGHGAPAPDPREHFDGQIDEVRIWNVARTPCEIRHNMHRPLRGDEPGLVGYWRFDEGDGQIAHDRSPFGNHGTLGVDDDPAGDISDPSWVFSGVDIQASAFPPPVWSEPQPFVAANSGAAEWRLVMSPDMLSFYVMTERDGHFADTQVYRAERASLYDPWSVPVPVAELNSGLHDNISFISPDDKHAYMSRHDNSLNSTIYETSRTDPSLPWGTPTVVQELAGQSRAYLTTDLDGLHGMFNSWIGSRQQLWRTSRPDRTSPWATPVEVAELNSSQSDGAPFLAPDGLTVYFWSNRPGTSGGGDIYKATRTSLVEPFSAPQAITVANSSYSERNPTLSPDGSMLFFNSDRPGGSGLNDIWFCAAVYSIPDSPAPDLDNDCDVDQDDRELFENCVAGPAVPLAAGCEDRDFDLDGDADQSDFGILQRCMSGPVDLADPACAD